MLFQTYTINTQIQGLVTDSYMSDVYKLDEIMCLNSSISVLGVECDFIL